MPILASRKPEARAFRKWVTSVVLPSIRKNGGYINGQEKVATGEMSEDTRVALGFVIGLSTTIEDNQRGATVTAAAVCRDGSARTHR